MTDFRDKHPRIELNTKKSKDEILLKVANDHTYETWIELLYDSKEPSFTSFVREAMELYATDRLDSYKEALRSAIAKTDSPRGDDYWMDGYEQGLLKAMELLDSVTPKE